VTKNVVMPARALTDITNQQVRRSSSSATKPASSADTGAARDDEPNREDVGDQGREFAEQQTSSDLDAETELRAELRLLQPRELKQRARELGVDPADIEALDDEDEGFDVAAAVDLVARETLGISDDQIVSWMWADAGTALTRRLAELNPLRWREGSLRQIALELQGSVDQRPVHLRLNGGERESFASPSEAAAWLEQQVPGGLGLAQPAPPAPPPPAPSPPLSPLPLSLPQPPSLPPPGSESEPQRESESEPAATTEPAPPHVVQIQDCGAVLLLPPVVDPDQEVQARGCDPLARETLKVSEADSGLDEHQIISWMWADAGTALTRRLAELNPLRWREGSLRQIALELQGSVDQRPVHLRLNGGERESFASPSEAAAWLEQQVPGGLGLAQPAPPAPPPPAPSPPLSPLPLSLPQPPSLPPPGSESEPQRESESEPAATTEPAPPHVVQIQDCGAVLLLPPVVDPDQEVQVNFRKDSILSGDWKPARVLARMGCRHVRVEGEREAFTPMRKYVFQVRVKHPATDDAVPPPFVGWSRWSSASNSRAAPERMRTETKLHLLYVWRRWLATLPQRRTSAYDTLSRHAEARDRRWTNRDALRSQGWVKDRCRRVEHAKQLEDPYWVPDDEELDCMCCGIKFREESKQAVEQGSTLSPVRNTLADAVLTEPRHHCRRCGWVICKHCSTRSTLGQNDVITGPDVAQTLAKHHRVCTYCAPPKFEDCGRKRTDCELKRLQAWSKHQREFEREEAMILQIALESSSPGCDSQQVALTADSNCDRQIQRLLKAQQSIQMYIDTVRSCCVDRSSKLPDVERDYGTRVAIEGMGEGFYTSFKSNIIEANDHTITFDGGEVKTLKIDLGWRVLSVPVLELVEEVSGYKVGDPCEIFSHSRQKWCPGKVKELRIINSTLRVEYLHPGASERVDKMIKADSELLRRRDDQEDSSDYKNQTKPWIECSPKSEHLLGQMGEVDRVQHVVLEKKITDFLDTVPVGKPGPAGATSEPLRALPPLTAEAAIMQEQQDAPAVLDTQAMRDAAGYVSSDIQDAVAEETTRLCSLAAAAAAEHAYDPTELMQFAEQQQMHGAEASEIYKAFVDDKIHRTERELEDTEAATKPNIIGTLQFESRRSKFLDRRVEVSHAGVLTVEGEAAADLTKAGTRVGQPKTPRPDRPFCVRIDCVDPVCKFVLDTRSEEEYLRWLVELRAVAGKAYEKHQSQVTVLLQVLARKQNTLRMLEAAKQSPLSREEHRLDERIAQIKQTTKFIRLKLNEFNDVLPPRWQKAQVRRGDWPEKVMTGRERAQRRLPLRILTIDGGGSKGLLPAIILEKLEEMCAPHKVHELFDLVCGTSTGGIIALGTCVAKFSSVQALTDVYEGRATEIWTSDPEQREAKYSAIGLETILQENSTDEEGKLMPLLNPDPERSWPKVFVVAAEEKQGKSKNAPFKKRLLRSYEPPRRSDAPTGCSLWEAARATAAAPTRFPPAILGPKGEQRRFLDGGLMANNPVQVALEEAQELWPNRKVGIILSLGCGSRETSGEEDDAQVDKIGGLSRRWLGAVAPVDSAVAIGAIESRAGVSVECLAKTGMKLFDQLTNCETEHEEALEALFGDVGSGPQHDEFGGIVGSEGSRPRRAEHDGANYLRINPTVTESMPMDTSDPAKLAVLRKAAQDYIADDKEAYTRLKELVERIRMEELDQSEPQPELEPQPQPEPEPEPCSW
jgi:predicted acylesterase/phospholipase RssA/GrpB-like predicted nucleotidyltransferase (UPF0157 family)